MPQKLPDYWSMGSTSAVLWAEFVTQSLAAKFYIDPNTNPSHVTDTFTAVHNYIQSPDFTTDTTDTTTNAKIHLGDYIDLDSLTVLAYQSEGDFSVSNTSLGANGRLLRLIVVGINSFNRDGAANNGNNTPHVVFQFQNIPVRRSMDTTAYNRTGYLSSKMRPYLTGNFYNGLLAAGVPSTVLWTPSRRVANGGKSAGGVHIIEDSVWLPTVWEMWGWSKDRSVNAYEHTNNQAVFEAYTTGTVTRYKYNSSNVSTWYYLASPYYNDYLSFCIFKQTGNVVTNEANGWGGVAPAFCVQ
ncbi:hypothetical protein AGMMS49940_24380 [Spirochaetia bacterium]|nr:hypothetical protein AGMMS49940_24380 [Spirochaetia bacterium]